MADVLDILPKIEKGQHAFIIDHGKIENGNLKYKDSHTSYEYNIHRYNLLTVGSLVLSRRPGRISRNGLFEIYGGGRVESISAPNSQGNVIANISHTFVFTDPIRQGDSFIESFIWDSKSKKLGTWSNFWSQYGINKISSSDFIRLVANRDIL